jgi:hypothetical protein
MIELWMMRDRSSMCPRRIRIRRIPGWIFFMRFGITNQLSFEAPKASWRFVSTARKPFQAEAAIA